MRLNQMIAMIALLLGAAALPGTGAAAVSNVSGSTSSCDLEFDYGVTGSGGMSGRYIGSFGNLPPSTPFPGAGLNFSCSVSGEGSGLLTVDYSMTNTSASGQSFDFIAFVDPNGDGQLGFSATYLDVPNVDFPATSDPGEPSSWEVDDIIEGNIANNVNNVGSLDNMDECDLTIGCDVAMALGWSLNLAPGEIGIVSVGLSDDGQTLSTRNLAASLDDGTGNPTDPTLTFSGNLTVIPLPAPLVLLGTALLGLLGLVHRRA